LSDASGQLQIGEVLLLPPDPSNPTGATGQPVPGLTLVIDDRGVEVTPGGSSPKAVPWDAITGWRVDPYDLYGRPGTVITVQTAERLFRFAAPGGDPVAIGHEMGQLARTHESAGRAGAAPIAGDTAGGPVAPVADRPGDSLAHWQPVLVTVLILALATAVALVLAQSAGAIHLPLLGGYGGGGSAVVPRP